MEEAVENKNYGYAKRPLWQWIALYTVIALVVYGLGYYLFFANKAGNAYNQTQTQPAAASPTLPPTTTESSANSIFLTKTDAAKGSFLADPKEMTIYIFDKDTKGASSCYGACATTWPPYLVTNPPTSLPTNITIIKRTDGSMQYVWKDMPLYHYAKDTKPGDITGDGVGGVWHIVKP